MINGYKAFEIEKYVDVEKSDMDDFDNILYSEDSLLLIKKYNSVSKLEENWKNQMYFIGGYIQAKFEVFNLPEACLWNTYIIYLVDYEVSNSLKIEIETDKFVCKKYVVDIRQEESESLAIIKELPALTSLILGNGIKGIVNDDKAIRELFLRDGNIDAKVSEYFLNENNLLNKPVESVISEMVGMFDE